MSQVGQAVSSEAPWWRIYVIKIVWEAPLRSRVDESVLNQLLDELFSGRVLHDPIQLYYQAAVEGLRSGTSLRQHDFQDEEAVRDLLERMVRALDERRPWPIPPYRPQSVNDIWGALRDGEPIGRIPMSEQELQKHFHQPFTTTGQSLRRPERVMALRLRPGQLVALRAKQRGDDHVELYTAADAAATRDAFHDLTGLDVQAPELDMRVNSVDAQADPATASQSARAERAITRIPRGATEQEREAFYRQIQRDDWEEWLRTLNGSLYNARMDKAHSYISEEEYLDLVASLRARFADAGIEFPEDL